MILHHPLKNISLVPPISNTGSIAYLGQRFGNVWIADKDMTINGIFVAKGQNVYKTAFGMDGHNGLDYVAPRNTPIYAIHDGWIVERVGKNTGFGLRISQRIEADNKFYLAVYGHQDHFSDPNEFGYNWNDKSHFVRQGELIGFVDSTGFSTGDHCHLGGYEMSQSGQTLNTNNGYGGAIDLLPFIKENAMEIYQVEGELTLVIKNLDGKFYYIATTPDLYPYVAEILGIKDKHFDPISKAIVEANLGGTAQAGLTFIKK